VQHRSRIAAAAAKTCGYRDLLFQDNINAAGPAPPLQTSCLQEGKSGPEDKISLVGRQACPWTGQPDAAPAAFYSDPVFKGDFLHQAVNFMIAIRPFS
jgi:hypothetical protein